MELVAYDMHDLNNMRQVLEAVLVSYPYYTKYTHEGDNTFFRHIDLNIRDLASSSRPY